MIVHTPEYAAHSIERVHQVAYVREISGREQLIQLIKRHEYGSQGIHANHHYIRYLCTQDILDCISQDELEYDDQC